jgi:ATP-dependent helicase HrpA
MELGRGLKGLIGHTQDLIADTAARLRLQLLGDTVGHGSRGQTARLGMAHTQPRRLAARTVANRIAEELQTEPGGCIGYKVRFSDHVSDNTMVKLMTDGILLAFR